MALTESQNADRPARPLAGLIAHIRAGLNAWLNDTSDRSVTQRVASAAFLIRVCSAALIYLSQIVLARWMGRTEFGIYVYVWTWVTLIGDMADLGLATAAQRFIPEYTKLKAFDRLRAVIEGQDRELALLRRAVERMAVERAELPEQPDYSETLAGMVQKIDATLQRADALVAAARDGATPRHVGVTTRK